MTAGDSSAVGEVPFGRKQEFEGFRLVLFSGKQKVLPGFAAEARAIVRFVPVEPDIRLGTPFKFCPAKAVPFRPLG